MQLPNRAQCFFKSRVITLICIAFVGMIVSGCSSTAEKSKIRVGSFNPKGSSDFHLVDARTEDQRNYSQTGKIQYLGDSNFEIPPIQLVATRFNEKLGVFLKGKEVSILYFQARITAPKFQTAGMPIEAALLGAIFGEKLGFPQLGYPHYANVSLRGIYQLQEFSGSNSVEFYLGTGESEISEAFDAAVSEAAANLQSLLTSGSK